MKLRRSLGLALVTVLSLLATAGAGSATAAQFHVTPAGATLTSSATTTHEFTFTGVSLKCNSVGGTGTAPAGGTSDSLTVSVALGQCSAFGFTQPSFNTFGCQLTYDANDATVDLKGCAAGGITVQVSVPMFSTKCHVLIKNQEGINNVTYVNHSPEKFITASTESTNVHVDVVESTFLCPLTVGTHANATYKGTLRIKANNGSGSIWRE